MFKKMAMTATALLMALVINAQEAKPVNRIELEGLVTSTPVPQGYQVSRQDLKQGDKLLGQKILITKKGTASKVIVTVEQRKLQTNGHKVAAFKGYVNGIAQSLDQAGLKLSKKNVPDISKVDLSKRQVAELIYTGPDESTVYVQIQVFFTDCGYNATVLATDKKDYDDLVKWAASIQPK